MVMRLEVDGLGFSFIDDGGTTLYNAIIPRGTQWPQGLRARGCIAFAHGGASGIVRENILARLAARVLSWRMRQIRVGVDIHLPAHGLPPPAEGAVLGQIAAGLRIHRDIEETTL